MRPSSDGRIERETTAPDTFDPRPSLHGPLRKNTDL